MRSFGTLLQEAPTNPTPVLSRAVQDRFADIVAFTARQMPSVNVGDRYRAAGAETEVIALARDGGQVAAYDHSVPSLTWISQRAFADIFTHVGAADPEVSRSAGLATLLSLVFDTPLDQHVVTSAAALADLLGMDEAYNYLDGLLDFEFTAENGPWTLDALLADASLYQAEQEDMVAEFEAAEPEAEGALGE